MLDKIASLRYSNYWLIFHALLGVASTFSPWVLIAWFYFTLFFNLSGLWAKNKIQSQNTLVGLIVYLGSFEILARMAVTSPFIPYELGKYLIFLLLVYGIVNSSNNAKSGLIMALLLLPGMFIGFIDSGLKALVFNALGPLNIALAIYYFYGRKIKAHQFISFLRLLIYPLLSVLFYTLIKSPDLDDVEFSLNANFETTGGFGSNQISTVFGAAMFLMFVFVWNNWKFSRYRWLDIGLLFLFSFRGLLSFSRGGMIGGALAILIVLVIQSRSFKVQSQATSSFKKLILYAPIIIAILAGTFFVADNITGGMLSLRYAGETAGTLSGSKEKSLNTLTTNRSEIFLEDVTVFSDHLLLGVGAGQSMNFRKNTGGQLPHVEMSRLLSEHGILGLIYFIMLLWQGFKILKHRKRPYQNVLLAFFILALYTTFHAATRTYFTPLFIGLSVISIVSNSKPANRIRKTILSNKTELNNSASDIGVSSVNRS